MLSLLEAITKISCLVCSRNPPKGCCFVGFMYQKTIKKSQNKTLWVVLACFLLMFVGTSKPPKKTLELGGAEKKN